MRDARRLCSPGGAPSPLGLHRPGRGRRREIYHDDAVLEFPSPASVRGHGKLPGVATEYPAQGRGSTRRRSPTGPTSSSSRTSSASTARLDADRRTSCEFPGDRVAHERIYVMEAVAPGGMALAVAIAERTADPPYPRLSQLRLVEFTGALAEVARVVAPVLPDRSSETPDSISMSMVAASGPSACWVLAFSRPAGPSPSARTHRWAGQESPGPG